MAFGRQGLPQRSNPEQADTPWLEPTGRPDNSFRNGNHFGENAMRSGLLWLIGVPIPIILLLALCTHHL